MRDREHYTILIAVLVLLLLFLSCIESSSQTPLQDAPRLMSMGWTVLPPGGPEIVHWFSGDGCVEWPLATTHMVVRFEFIIPVEIGGSLLPEPRFNMMLPLETIAGRIWWAPVLMGGDTLSFGEEVDIMTGEILEDQHYGPQPGDWFMERY